MSHGPAPNPWAPPTTGSSTMGPPTRALFATYQNLIARGSALETQLKVGLSRLDGLARLAPELELEPPGPPRIAAALLLLSRADASREAARLFRELGEHRELLRGVETGRLVVRPSQERPYDLDIGEAEAGDARLAGELGFLPILAGLAVLGRLALIGGALVLTSRAVDHLEFRWKAKLIEAGQDISKLAEPAADLGTKVSRVTTPLAFAAGAVAAAVIVTHWKKPRA